MYSAVATKQNGGRKTYKLAAVIWRNRRSDIIVTNSENLIRRYLLGQLDEAEQEGIELRLLTDPSFGEEFDTIVDELTDQYVREELTGDDRKLVEKYFLNTPERKQKLEFATELLSRAGAQRGERDEKPIVQPVVEREPSWFEQFFAFWKRQSLAHAALTVASVIVVVGVVFVVMRSGRSPQYAEINATLNTSTRAEGPSPLRVQRPEAGFKINLAIPENARDARGFRARLLDGNGTVQDVKVDERKDQSVVVLVPAALLARGSYAIQLTKIKADGTEERVRGSYYFDVE